MDKWPTKQCSYACDPTVVSSCTPTDLESLTEKACSARKYDAFIAMLLAALRRTSGSVSLDILSFSDLAAMKSGVGRTAGGVSTAPGAASASKRYLILTYVSEFERVHYPLPLSPQNGGEGASAGPPAAGLAMSDLLAEISHLRKECSALRRQLRSAGRATEHANESGLSAALQRVRSVYSTQTRRLQTCAVGSILLITPVYDQASLQKP